MNRSQAISDLVDISMARIHAAFASCSTSARAASSTRYRACRAWSTTSVASRRRRSGGS